MRGVPTLVLVLSACGRVGFTPEIGPHTGDDGGGGSGDGGGIDGTHETGSAATYPVGASPQGLAIADFDGDGHADVAVALFTGSIAVLRGDGAGGFADATTYPTSATSASGLATADFNRDGKPDLAIMVYAT